MNAPVDVAELIKLCAVDSDLFGRTFFPRAFRQKSPPFSKKAWAALENPAYRQLALKLFRGAGKTTLLRAFAAKRIAYNVSRTILYIGASEAHATRSVQWLRGQIEPRIGNDGVARATPYAQVFGLRPGRKWQEHEFEVFHGIDQSPIWVLGVGVTGTIRGINFDDYRPDLIIVDDVVTDENAATQAAAEKLNDLILNAVANSLASSQEFPNAKMVMLQTPISPDDISAKAEQSDEWHVESFGCWTSETEDLEVDRQESAWPEVFPSETLRKRKLASIAERRYSGFAREMECKLVASETVSFGKWLRFRDAPDRPGATVIAIDPVPPPSETQIRKNLQNKDYEAIAVVSRTKGEYDVLEYRMHRGHNPDWTEEQLFALIGKYHPMFVVVEAIAAQRYLKWFLQKAMERRRVFVPLQETPNDQRSKFLRIVTSLSGVASAGRLFCSPAHADFALQFEGYGPGYRGNDDLLEAVSVGVAALANPYLELADDEYLLNDDNVPELKTVNACP